MARLTSTIIMLTLLALSGAACSNFQTASQPGHFDAAGEMLVAPTEYSTGNAQGHHPDDYLPEGAQ